MSKYLNPYFGIAIKSRTDGFVCSLTPVVVNNDDIRGKVNDYYPIASSIEINTGLSYINEVSVNLSPDIGTWFKLLESLYLDIGNYIYIEYGYTNPKISRTIVCQILEPPSISFGTSPNFKISGKGVGFGALMSKPDVNKIKQYNGKKFDEFIDEFARSYNITVVRKEYGKELGEVIVSNYPLDGDDWHNFTKFLAELNCVAYQFGEELVILSIDRAYMSASVYKMLWGGEVDLDKGVYPIIDFEVNTEGVFLPAEIYGSENYSTFVFGNNVINKISLMDYKLEPPGLDVRNVFKTDYAMKALEDNPPVDTLIFPDSVDSNIRELTIRKILNEKSNRVFSGTLNTIGNANLLPGIIVDVNGLGKIFDGKYMVFSSTHTIDSKGFSALLEVKKNAFSELHSALENQKVNNSRFVEQEGDYVNKEIE